MPESDGATSRPTPRPPNEHRTGTPSRRLLGTQKVAIAIVSLGMRREASRSDPARTRTVQTSGAEHGLHERARQSEIQAYFDDILHHRFVESGHVTFLGGSEHHREGDEHHVTSLPRCRPHTTVRAHQRLRPTSVRRNRHLRRNRRARRRHRPNPQRNHRSTPRRRPDHPRPRHPGPIADRPTQHDERHRQDAGARTFQPPRITHHHRTSPHSAALPEHPKITRRCRRSVSREVAPSWQMRASSERRRVDVGIWVSHRTPCRALKGHGDGREQHHGGGAVRS